MKNATKLWGFLQTPWWTPKSNILDYHLMLKPMLVCSCDRGVTNLTSLCNALQDVKPGSVDRLLIEESREFLKQACVRIYSGKNALEPDIMLKLGDEVLPAHRSLLAESSDFYKAMFQAGSPHSKIVFGKPMSTSGVEGHARDRSHADAMRSEGCLLQCVRIFSCTAHQSCASKLPRCVQSGMLTCSLGCQRAEATLWRPRKWLQRT